MCMMALPACLCMCLVSKVVRISQWICRTAIPDACELLGIEPGSLAKAAIALTVDSLLQLSGFCFVLRVRKNMMKWIGYRSMEKSGRMWGMEKSVIKIYCMKFSKKKKPKALKCDAFLASGQHSMALTCDSKRLF